MLFIYLTRWNSCKRYSIKWVRLDFSRFFSSLHAAISCNARWNGCATQNSLFLPNAVWHTPTHNAFSGSACLFLYHGCALLAIFVALTFVFMLMNNAQRICTIIITLLLSSLVRSLMTQQNELWFYGRNDDKKERSAATTMA